MNATYRDLKKLSAYHARDYMPLLKDFTQLSTTLNRHDALYMSALLVVLLSIAILTQHHILNKHPLHVADIFRFGATLPLSFRSEVLPRLLVQHAHAHAHVAGPRPRPRRLRCLTCKDKVIDGSLRTVIKHRGAYKPVEFCSFKCFEDCDAI